MAPAYPAALVQNSLQGADFIFQAGQNKGVASSLLTDREMWWKMKTYSSFSCCLEKVCG